MEGLWNLDLGLAKTIIIIIKNIIINAGIHNRLLFIKNLNIFYQVILGLNLSNGFSNKLYIKVEIKNNKIMYIGVIK